VQDKQQPDLSLFVDILKTLEMINAPYMIIGAFAGTVYGVNRVTYDIDIVVDLSDEHIKALSEAYPLPRYYADPEMIRNSIDMGIMFNIIDTNRGEKADLIPLTGALDYRLAFKRRVRQLVEVHGVEPFEVWCARVEDIIMGKLLAWQEGRSRKHETDIFDILVFHYSKKDAEFRENGIDTFAKNRGGDVWNLWNEIKSDAKKEAEENKS
jgi:hypothetical protein